MTQGLGTVTDRYDYGAWGEPRVILGGTTDNPYLYVGQHGYYAHWMDPALADALQLGVRFYEPQVGRFISRDPIGYEGVLNLYSYVGNMPTVAVDPLGLALWLEYDDMRNKWSLVDRFAYTHAWIRFYIITCKGKRNYGFWPNGINTEPDEPYAKDKPGQPNVYVVKINHDERFERCLCDCIKGSQESPPQFSTGLFSFYVCGSWVKDMWECAEQKCKCGEPKTPPGGD